MKNKRENFEGMACLIAVKTFNVWTGRNEWIYTNPEVRKEAYGIK